MKRRTRSVALSMLSALALATPALASSRHLAIVVDTSSSMRGADPQRYTMQLSQVLSDLLDDNDRLSVIRMPAQMFSFCSERPSPGLVLRLDPTDRAGFKRQLDGLIAYNTGTFFGAPIRTAISILPGDRDAQRMLLVIADSGGLGNCENALTRELLDLKNSGVTVAAINIGSSSGAFDRNPAFDFTTAALDSQGLIEAVALVYQRFLGAKQVQTGRVQGEVSVEIAPFVNEAFLVIAADGPIAAIEQLAGNPSAAAVDLDHRGGGATQGLDGVLRGYRIVRLRRPAAGQWRFRGVGIGDRAGWMLLQDSAVGVRLVSSPMMARGAATPIEVELFDQRTGARIRDTSKLPGLRTELELDGRTVGFRDDGKEGDRQAGDGILTATTTFDRIGIQPLSIHLQSNLLDRRIALDAKIVDAAWQLEVQTPRRGEVDRPVPLSVAVQPIGGAESLQPPARIDVATEGRVVELHDDGKGGDRKPGDRVFTRDWSPSQPGNLDLQYSPVGGSPSSSANARMEVLGRLRFGPPIPLRLGRLESGAVGNGRLDLSSADVRGDFEVKVSTAFQRERSVLELDGGSGWITLGSEPRPLPLTENGRRTWGVRLRVGECPEGHPAARPFDIVVSGTGADGQPVRTAVPVTAEIVPDSWLHCWWPVLALLAGVAATGIVIHGFWSPSRFPPRLGVVLSPEEDIEEGFFHAIRGERGSSSGFYRDARIYICNDFRLAGRPRNALVRLRADRRQVRIEPSGGGAVWRRTTEGSWEQIPPGESTARFGDLYRNDPGSLFFELRNA